MKDKASNSKNFIGGGKNVTSSHSSHIRWAAAFAMAFAVVLFVFTPQHAQCSTTHVQADSTVRHDTVIKGDTLIILPVGDPVAEGDTVVFE